MNEKKIVRKPKAAAPKRVRLYERFHWTQRAAHALLVLSFSMLAITGLPQKYATAGWAQWMIARFGGIDTTRQIHHVCAIILMLLVTYHILDLGYKIFVKHVQLSMLPGFKDIKDAWQAFMYNIGLSKKKPQMGRYGFEEKAEYWALIWGTVMMAITGFMMWNPITTARVLPGEVIPASKAAHGGEALLAVLAIVVWHMYGVHIKRFNKSMFTGKQTEDEMLHEHPLELADIKAGVAERVQEPRKLRRRQVIYWPVAGVLAVGMLLGIYGFVNGEKTAIKTVLPISNPVPIYLPQTPTPAPTVTFSEGPLTWDGSIGGLLTTKCSSCHATGLASKGLDLTSYASAMKGASTGAVIVPGDAAASLLIQIQSAGGHPGQLSQTEITRLKDWIAAGAPEK